MMPRFRFALSIPMFQLNHLVNDADRFLNAGRSLERPVLSEAEIDSNIAGIRSNIETILQPEGGASSTVMNNLVSHVPGGKAGYTDADEFYAMFNLLVYVEKRLPNDTAASKGFCRMSTSKTAV